MKEDEIPFTFSLKAAVLLVPSVMSRSPTGWQLLTEANRPLKAPVPLLSQRDSGLLPELPQ